VFTLTHDVNTFLQAAFRGPRARDVRQGLLRATRVGSGSRGMASASEPYDAIIIGGGEFTFAISLVLVSTLLSNMANETYLC